MNWTHQKSTDPKFIDSERTKRKKLITNTNIQPQEAKKPNRNSFLLKRERNEHLQNKNNCYVNYKKSLKLKSVGSHKQSLDSKSYISNSYPHKKERKKNPKKNEGKVCFEREEKITIKRYVLTTIALIHYQKKKIRNELK